MALSLRNDQSLPLYPIMEMEFVFWFFFTELPTPSPSLALLGRALAPAWITPTRIGFFIYKKGEGHKPLKYLNRVRQFLRVFVQIMILFAQNSLVKLSELVQSAVRIRSKSRMKNEQR
jgi:hypothetical protein